MMDTDALLHFAVQVSLALLCLSFALTVFRVIRGPTLPDRILALDMLVATAIGFIAVIGISLDSPPMRRMSCSSPRPWMTDPAARNNRALKKAWVTTWKMAAT